MISTEYKISEKMNDLNTSKITKETQQENIKDKENPISRDKFSPSHLSGNAFDHNDAQKIMNNLSTTQK